MIDDGIITGQLMSYRRKCQHCGRTSRVVKVETVHLPEGITHQATILRDPQGGVIQYIGLDCGDYAKFHRQVTHIQERMARHPG